MENKAPDWKIAELYEKSWEAVKKNKVLWIFGAAISGIGIGSNSSSRINSSDLDSFKEIFSPNTPSTEGATQVLGAATSGVLETLAAQVFSSIPPYLYFVLGLEILLFFILAIVLAVISSAWLQGAIIQASNSALDNQPVTIRDCSEKSFKSITSLIWLQIVPSLVLIVPSLLLTVLFGVGMVVISETAFRIILGLLFLVSLSAFVYIAVYLTLSQIWATRKVVLDGEKGKPSLISGYKISRKKGGSMILLGIVNNILSAIIIGIPILVLVGLIFGAILGGDGSTTALILRNGFVIALILFLPVFIIGLTLLNGILTAFKTTVWTLAYKNIRGKYD